MPADASTKPERTSGSRLRPRALSAVRRGARPRHEQEHQHVVDRHDDADERAMLAEHVADERRQECADERTGDARRTDRPGRRASRSRTVPRSCRPARLDRPRSSRRRQSSGLMRMFL